MVSRFKSSIDIIKNREGLSIFIFKYRFITDE